MFIAPIESVLAWISTRKVINARCFVCMSYILKFSLKMDHFLTLCRIIGSLQLSKNGYFGRVLTSFSPFLTEQI